MKCFKFLAVPIVIATIGTGGHVFAQKMLQKLAPRQITLSKAVLKDKIKGGWAGQTIGVTLGCPSEFRL